MIKQLKRISEMTEDEFIEIFRKALEANGLDENSFQEIFLSGNIDLSGMLQQLDFSPEALPLEQQIADILKNTLKT
jgi:hypothetical protein